jgi:DNA-binding response OmpR family regulator
MRVRSEVREMVVIVEDDAQIRETLAAALTFEGFEVSTLGTGKALAAGIPFMFPPSVVILDLTLGDMGGAECLRAIRASHWTDVPVLIFSGWGHLERFGLDAQTLLSKTGDIELVVRAVDRLAKGAAVRASSRAEPLSSRQAPRPLDRLSRTSLAVVRRDADRRGRAHR